MGDARSLASEKSVHKMWLWALSQDVSHVLLEALPRPVPFRVVPSAVIRMWMRGSWNLHAPLSRPTFLAMIGRVAEMIRVDLPLPGQPAVSGRVLLDISGKRDVYILVLIEHTGELSALFEFVSAVDFVERSRPEPPTVHPYRAG